MIKWLFNEKLKRLGKLLSKLSIKNFFISVGFISLLIIVLYLGFVEKLKLHSSHLTEFEQNRVKMIEVANTIRHSSDNLTKFARLYAITKNSEYKDNFYKILDIRDGVSNRPERYRDIYWELSSATREIRHKDLQKRSIGSLIKELPFDEYEIKKLLESEKNLNRLIELEIEAFNAIDGVFKDEKGGYSIHREPDQEFAIATLHSKEYLLHKENIMLPIDEFLLHLRERVDSDLKRHLFHVNRYGQYIELLSILSVLFLIYLFLSIKSRVLKPAERITKAIELFKENMDDNTELIIENRDEMGLIAEQFNSMKSRIQDDLKNREAQDRELQEYIKLVDQNIITSSTDLNGNITYVSQAFIDISGYSKNELIGKRHNIVRHPNMSGKVYKTLWNTITNDRTWRGEIENRRKDGSSYWVKATIYPTYNIDGERVGYTAIRTDITDEKRVEKLLKYAEERERELQHYIDLVDENLITSSTDLEGNITYVSKAFIDISGYSKSELIGKKHNLVKNESVSSSLYSELWDYITHNRTWRGEINNRRRDGAEYWIKATIYPNFNQSGEKTGFTSIGIDITDKKRIE